MGITPTVINMRFVKPIDAAKLMAEYQQGNLLVTMEEHALEGGFGSAVLEFFNEQQTTDAKVLRIGIDDAFVPHGKTDLLKEISGLDSATIAKKIMGTLAGE